MSDDLFQRIMTELKTITNPRTGRDIVTEGNVKSLNITEDKIVLILEINPSEYDLMKPVQFEAEEIIRKSSETRVKQVIMTAHSSDGKPPSGPVETPPNLKSPAIKKKGPPAKSNPDGVKKIIAIASGKGGVGKSTVASNLAVAMAAQGKKIALLDADVYGPSQPRMLGLSGRPSSPDGKTILPLRNHGVTAMSIGLMIPENESIVWRGPMLMGALQQLLNQVQWGEQDILFVDLPPGTGDVQLTLCQKTNLYGAIIVSTPQDIALLDARKGIDMFKRLSVPILGLIENMSSFICSGCGMTHHPFSNGSVKKEAKQINTEFLGELPLDFDTRVASDSGVPIVASQPQNTTALAFVQLAKTIVKLYL